MTPSEIRDDLRAWLETAEVCERGGLREAAIACAQMGAAAADALTESVKEKTKKTDPSKPVRKAITRISQVK